eukprot:361663-Prymnesium_polylepis.1
MPVCFRCEKERPKDCFTAKQLKAAAAKRFCKACAREAKTQLSSSKIKPAQQTIGVPQARVSYST